MRFTDTAIPSAYLIDLEPLVDDRGSFTRLFCGNELDRQGIVMEVAQINHSANNHAGTVRGLHFQVPPACDAKLVQCLRGRIFDVIVDLRKGSPTFLRWIGIELSADKRQMLLVPQGCAHGFQTLEPKTEVLYFHSAPYSPPHDRGIRHDDPLVRVQLPLPVSIITEKDANHPLLDPNFDGVQA